MKAVGCKQLALKKHAPRLNWGRIILDWSISHSLGLLEHAVPQITSLFRSASSQLFDFIISQY
jgi:hypothetical protein